MLVCQQGTHIFLAIFKFVKPGNRTRSCFQVVKAQEAGAVAVIITDADEENDDLFIIMQDDTTEREVSIPAGFLLGMNGYDD